MAVANFLGTYIQGTHFTYLPSIYMTMSTTDPIYAATHAAALAVFSREVNDEKIMRQARQQYCTALELVNCAIASTKHALLDETLASVLLLCHFERTEHSGAGPLGNWTRHLYGAASLLSLRPLSSLSLPLGRSLFLQVFQNLRTSCIQRRERMPKALLQLRARAAGVLMLDATPTLVLAPVMDAVAELRASIEEGLYEDDMAMIEAAVQIERMVTILLENFPQEWQYDLLVARHPSQETCAHQVHDLDIVEDELPMHHYRSMDMLQLWSSIRMVRLYLSELVHKTIDKMLYFYHTLTIPWTLDQLVRFQEQTRKVGRSMAQDICASVPQCLHDTSNCCSIFASSFRQYDNMQCLTLISAGSLLWPLSMAGASLLASDEVKRFAKAHLPLLRCRANLPSTVGVAELLDDAVPREGKPAVSWYVKLSCAVGCVGH
jgi:hypothetical protein